MSYKIKGIRNYTILFNEDVFELVLNEDRDYVFTSWTVKFNSEISSFMNQAGIYDVWTKLLPRDIDFPAWECLEDRHIDWIKNLPDPKMCLNILEEYNFLDKAKGNDKILLNLKWLKEKWEQGFYIYLSD